MFDSNFWFYLAGLVTGCSMTFAIMLRPYKRGWTDGFNDGVKGVIDAINKLLARGVEKVNKEEER